MRAAFAAAHSGQACALRYTRVAVALHWIVAVVVIAQFAWGWWMLEIPKQPPGSRAAAFNLHKSVGLVILALMVLRLGWQMRHRAPTLGGLPAWQQVLARCTHVTLYVALIAMPVAGYLGSVFSGYPVEVIRRYIARLGMERSGAQGTNEWDSFDGQLDHCRCVHAACDGRAQTHDRGRRIPPQNGIADHAVSAASQEARGFRARRRIAEMRRPIGKTQHDMDRVGTSTATCKCVRAACTFKSPPLIEPERTLGTRTFDFSSQWGHLPQNG